MAHPQYPRGYTAKSYRQRALPGRTEVPSDRQRRIRIVSLACRARLAFLLNRLRAAGVAGQAAALVARDPAARVSLDDPADVASPT